MARPKRIDLAFSLFHVFSRTNSGDIAFQDERDQNKFLEYLARYVFLFDYRVHAWCLMPTHFHLLLESAGFPRLSEFMRRLLTAYTVYYNRRHKRHGHLFQGRFKSYIVDKADYLIPLSRYIHLNPKESLKSIDPFHCQRSSLMYYLKGGEPDFLHTGEILSWFGKDRKKYEKYIREGMKEGQKIEIIQQRFIGGKFFPQRIYQRIKAKSKKGSRADRAARQAEGTERKIEEKKAREIIERVGKYYDIEPSAILKGSYARRVIGKARTVAIRLLRDEVTWTGKEIGKYLGLKKSIYEYWHKVEERKDLKQDYEKLKKVS